MAGCGSGGARLAEILSLPVEQAGPVSSWNDLMKHEDAILKQIRFIRLKKLASCYDAGAIRRAVARNRENMENGIRMPTNSWSGLMPGKKSWGLSSRGLKRPDRTKKIS